MLHALVCGLYFLVLLALTILVNILAQLMLRGLTGGASGKVT